MVRWMTIYIEMNQEEWEGDIREREEKRKRKLEDLINKRGKNTCKKKRTLR